jgi:hypothetical protein
MRAANDRTQFLLRGLPKLLVTTEAFWQESLEDMELLNSWMSLYCMIGYNMFILLPDKGNSWSSSTPDDVIRLSYRFCFLDDLNCFCLLTDTHYLNATLTTRRVII